MESETKKSWLRFIKTLGLGVLIAILYEKLSMYGVLGLLLLIIGFIIYRIWKGRELLMIGIRNIESIMWGKPLDKGTWKKGELKQKWKRTKFVWKTDEPIGFSLKPLWTTLILLIIFIIFIWVIYK